MTPNTRKPTVSDGDVLWVWYQLGGFWKVHRTSEMIALWPAFKWLPYSAIPDPSNEQQQGATP